MKEMRRDQITGDLIIYSSYRNKRPHDTIKSNKSKSSEGPQYSDTCPFCRGNEHLNDMPTHLIEKEGQWLAKSVKNKFPIVDMETDYIYGEHEVKIYLYQSLSTQTTMDLLPVLMLK